MDLGYDLEEALRRRSNNISRKSIEALRNAIANSNLVPKSITDKQVRVKTGSQCTSNIQNPDLNKEFGI